MGLTKPYLSYSKIGFHGFILSGASMFRNFTREGRDGAPYRIFSQSLRAASIKAKNPAFHLSPRTVFRLLGANTPSKRFPGIIADEDLSQSSVESEAVKILFTKTVFDML
jgi:hypothetical protein